MKDSLNLIKFAVMVLFLIKMELIKDILLMEKEKELVYTSIQTETFTKVIGKMIRDGEKEEFNTGMGIFFKGSFNRIQKMEKDFTNGEQILTINNTCIMDILRRTSDKAKENILLITF
jgi:hypothetical protein